MHDNRKLILVDGWNFFLGFLERTQFHLQALNLLCIFLQFPCLHFGRGANQKGQRNQHEADRVDLAENLAVIKQRIQKSR